MRSLQQLALVGAGGVLGAIVRWGIITTPDRALLADAISIPTLAVNVVGCLLLGMLLANPLPEQAHWFLAAGFGASVTTCLLYTSPSPRDKRQSRMPSSA